MSDFLEQLFDKIDTNNVLWIQDNHRAHHSRRVMALLARQGVEVLFTPSYSSPLNAVEYVWGNFKIAWSKAIATLRTEYDMDNFERDIELVMNEVSDNLTPKNLVANEKYMVKCMQGILV